MNICEVCESTASPLTDGLCSGCADRLATHRAALAELEGSYQAALTVWLIRWAAAPDVMQDAPTLAYSAGLTVSESLTPPHAAHRC